MKTKYTIFSMAIFLFVFWFSVMLDIKKPPISAERELPATEDNITVAAKNQEEPVSYPPISYSFDGAHTASYDNRLYLTQGIDTDVVSGNTEENAISSFAAGPSIQDSPENTESVIGLDTETAAAAIIASDAVPTPNPTDPAEAVQAELPPVTDAVQTKEKEPADIKSQYSDIAISNAESYVNIREKADTDSKVLGKLFRDSAAKILDTIGDWYYVESGSVKGYIKAEYLKTGIPDEELIEKYGVLRISVNVDGLNVREKPNTESDKLTVVYLNETYPVIDLQDEWIKVDITDDRVIGYVKRDFAELIVNFKKAVSKEEEQELLRLKEKERLKQETAVKYREEVDYTKEELKLLACLVHAEAGNQSYEGKLAVANIVLNRVKSSKYPNSIKAVIYQPGQFSVAKSGSLTKQMNNYNYYSSNSQLLSIKAARAALEGANNIGNRLYFHSLKSAVKKGYDDKKNAVRLEDHLFW